MLKKFYEKIIGFIKEEYKFIIFLIILMIICTWPVNYYIVIGGGISDIGDRVVVDDGYTSKGSFNLSYVSELKGTTLSYLVSYLIPNWERVSMDDYKYTTDEDYQDIEFRSEVDLLTSNSNAIYYAYHLANKPCKLTSTDVYVIATISGYENPFEVGDQLVQINGTKYQTLQEFQQAIQEVDDKQVSVTVIRDGKEQELTCKLYREDSKKVVGVALQAVNHYEVDPEVELAFENKRWLDLVRSGKAEEVMKAYGERVKANPQAYYFPEGYSVSPSSYTNIPLLYALPAADAALSPYF